jgi:hypothetical protein
MKSQYGRVPALNLSCNIAISYIHNPYCEFDFRRCRRKNANISGSLLITLATNRLAQSM